MKETASLSLAPFVASAHASSKKLFRVPTRIVAASLKEAKKRFDIKNKQTLPKVLGDLAKSLSSVNAASLRRYVFSPRLWLAATAMAARNGKEAMQNFLKGRSNARYSPLAIMSIVAYLEWETSCGKALDQKSGDSEGTPEELESIDETLENLECNEKGIRGGYNRRQMYVKQGIVFSDAFIKGLTEDIDDDDKRIDDAEVEDYKITGGGHGALFHLAQIARYQMQYRATGKNPIKAIEGFRRVWIYSDGESRKEAGKLESQDEAKSEDYIVDAYSRQVDIVLGEENEAEQWVELKSYSRADGSPTALKYLKGKPIEQWNLEKSVSNAESLHRQFSLDRSASHVGHARLSAVNKLNEVIDVSQDFKWLFQKFDVSVKKTGSGSPTEREINVTLGGEGNKKTILGAFALPIDNSESKKKYHNITEVRKANFGSAKFGSKSHVELADSKELLKDLVDIGFTEALDDVVEF
ncbi:hypothetical protein A3759_17200 [Thalassolituus sp. HI0120]|nr:hypothetical protein A3759_17200 [Thalassolituus sp. HI0120]